GSRRRSCVTLLARPPAQDVLDDHPCHVVKRPPLAPPLSGPERRDHHCHPDPFVHATPPLFRPVWPYASRQQRLHIFSPTNCITMPSTPHATPHAGLPCSSGACSPIACARYAPPAPASSCTPPPARTGSRPQSSKSPRASAAAP